MLLNFNTCDFRQLLCRLFILRGAGRRTEHQRIGNDCGAKQPCDFLIHFHVIFLIQIINNRTCAAYRLIAEKYGQRRFHTAQSVMVDNFQNFCLINAINCLPLLIMVNQYNFLIIHIQQGASGKHAAILPISIQNREISVADFCQCITDVADEILSAEGNQMILFHKITHGCRLRNQSCYHQGIMRCADDFAVIFLCQLLNCLRNRCAGTNHDAACVHLDTAKLIFKTVPGQKHIAIFYIVFQQIRICRTNQNFPLCNFFLGIADNHCTINRIQNIRIFCVGYCQNPCFVDVHIRRCDILNGNNALQHTIVYNGHGGFTQVSHFIPRIFQGNTLIQGGRGLNLHILHLCADMTDEFRRFHIEKIQHVLCFVVNLACSFRYKYTIIRFIFQRCIGNRRADGICIRIFMPNDKYLLFL